MTDGWNTPAIVARGVAATATCPAAAKLLDQLGGDRIGADPPSPESIKARGRTKPGDDCRTLVSF